MKSEWLASSVCTEFRRTTHRALRKILEKCRKKIRGKGKQLPVVFPIRIHGCEVKVSVHQRSAYILADEAALKWKQTGLYRAVKDYLDVDNRAIRHIVGRTAGDKVLRMLRSRDGIRDKVHWMPDKSAWGVKFKGTVGDDKIYCNENGLSLTIQSPLCNQTYDYAWHKAFHDACKTWNAVDKSGRKRIRMPELPLGVRTDGSRAPKRGYEPQ